MKLITIQDIKAECFLPVQTFKTKVDGIRAFETAVNNPDSQFNKYPEDFIMHEIGDFDELTGITKIHDRTIVIATAAELLQ